MGKNKVCLAWRWIEAAVGRCEYVDATGAGAQARNSHTPKESWTSLTATQFWTRRAGIRFLRHAVLAACEDEQPSMRTRARTGTKHHEEVIG